MLTKQEKRTTLLAIGAGVLVLVIYYGLWPLWNEWNRLGQILAPKLSYVQRLEEKAAARDGLIARRDTLAKKLGYLDGEEPKPAPAKAVPAAAGSAGPAPAAPPAAGKESAPAPAAPAIQINREPAQPPAADPADPAALAAKAQAEAKARAEAKAMSLAMAAEAKRKAGLSAAQNNADTPADASAPAEKTEAAPPVAKPVESVESVAAAKKESGKPEGDAAKKKEEKPPVTSVALTTYIEKQAGAAGIQLISITPSTLPRGYVNAGHYEPVGLQVSMETNTPSLIKLLHALEMGKRLVRIEQMDLRHDVAKGQTVNVSLHLIGYEYTAK